MVRRYRAALTAAGLDPAFRFHDLRHTFGTSIARAGEPVTTIQAWLGHGDLKTTQRYMHYAPAADEAERVERAFVVTPELPRREADRAS
jgi:integrase